MPELVLALVARANLLAADDTRDDGTDATVPAQINAWMEPLWSQFASLTGDQQRQLVLAMEPGLPGLDAVWLARLEQSQRQWPNNPYLQYLTGQACRQRKLWGKAAQLLGQASHSLQEPALLRRTWCALALLAEERGDGVGAQTAWKRAALMGD